MSIHQHQPTSLFSLLLWDRLLFPPNNPLLTTAARTATGSSGSSRSLVSTWCSSLLARTSSFFSAPSLDAGTTAVARGTAGSPEAQLLERATEAISKRSSSPPSSPPSRAHERGGTEPNSNGSDSKTKNSNTVAEALVELCLTLGIVVISSYLLSLLTRRMLKGYPGNELLEDGDNVPAGSVYAKLERILQKRASQQLTTTTATATKATTAATTAKITVPHLTPRELQMADEILDPDDIESSFADIGGLDNTKQEIYELAVLPLVRPGALCVLRCCRAVCAALLLETLCLFAWRFCLGLVLAEHATHILLRMLIGGTFSLSLPRLFQNSLARANWCSPSRECSCMENLGQVRWTAFVRSTRENCFGCAN